MVSKSFRWIMFPSESNNLPSLPTITEFPARSQFKITSFNLMIKEFFDPNTKLYELFWVQFVRILAIVCGVLLLRSINWARWLAIAWLLYHVLISAFHSPSDVIVHIVFLLLVVVLLYLPKSSAFFQMKNQH